MQTFLEFLVLPRKSLSHFESQSLTNEFSVVSQYSRSKREEEGVWGRRERTRCIVSRIGSRLLRWGKLRGLMLGVLPRIVPAVIWTVVIQLQCLPRDVWSFPIYQYYTSASSSEAEYPAYHSTVTWAKSLGDFLFRLDYSGFPLLLYSCSRLRIPLYHSTVTLARSHRNFLFRLETQNNGCSGGGWKTNAKQSLLWRVFLSRSRKTTSGIGFLVYLQVYCA